MVIEVGIHVAEKYWSSSAAVVAVDASPITKPPMSHKRPFWRRVCILKLADTLIGLTASHEVKVEIVHQDTVAIELSLIGIIRVSQRVHGFAGILVQTDAAFVVAQCRA